MKLSEKNNELQAGYSHAPYIIMHFPISIGKSKRSNRKIKIEKIFFNKKPLYYTRINKNKYGTLQIKKDS